MMHSRPILSLAFFLLVAIDPLPAATPIHYIDYMLMSRTAKIVLDCDPPSCRLLLNRDEDFDDDNDWVLNRATGWMKDWGRFRILDDIREADLVVHLDCAQPDLRDLLYGMRTRWMKMEVYAGGYEGWQKFDPIWKRQLDPVPTCNCRDAVVHILTEYRAEIERLEQARGKSLRRRPSRPALMPSWRESNRNK